MKKSYKKTKYPCIYKDENTGKYAVDISKRINGKQLRTTKTGLENEKEAKEILKNADELLQELYNKKYKKVSEIQKKKESNDIITFDYYLDKYFNHVLLETNNQNTIYKKKNKFRHYITPYFKKDDGSMYDIREIDVTTIEGFKQYLNDIKKVNNEPLSIDTKNTVFAQLSAYFNYLTDYLEVLDKNPCKNVKNFKVPKKEIVYYTLEQFNKLMDTIDNDEKGDLKTKLLCKAILSILLYTGYRPSEVFGLKFKYFDYDLINESEINTDIIKIKFDETLVYSKGGWLVSDGKTEESKTNSYIGKKSLLPLFNYIKYMNNKELVYNPNDYIFLNPATGKVYSLENIRKMINKYMDEAELPRLKLKDFRHSTGTLLLSNGASLEEVKEKLRHTSIRTTEKHYATFYEENKMNIAKSMDRIINM